MTSVSRTALEEARARLLLPTVQFLRQIPSVREVLSATAMLLGAELYLRRFEVLRDLQQALPLLVLGQPEYLSEALALGCSDYLRDPWSPDELLARLGRRAQRMECALYGERIALRGDRLEARDREVTLEPGEVRMLRALMLAAGSAVDRGFLALLAGLPPGGEGGSRALDARISRLRRKVKLLLSNALQGRAIIRAVYGIGYRLECG